MTTSRRVAALVAALALLAPACGGGSDGVDSAAPPTIERTTTTADEADLGDADGDADDEVLPTADEPPGDVAAGVDGDLRLGEQHVALDGTVGAAGTTATVDRGALDGLRIDVPAGAFTSTTPLDVSYRDISTTTYGDAIDPVTPLIEVDTGGAPAAEVMTVQIPVNVPEGSFAMGFFYDDGRLEAMPLVQASRYLVTVATEHFSSFFVSAIEYALLPDDVGTGFRVQEDNWRFTNYGTYAEPGGICAGMSLTAMWYFLERKAAEGPLWTRWDDNGAQDTPTFWYDDAWAQRWATDVHRSYGARWLATNHWVADQAVRFDRLQYDAFRYAMYVTGEPQYIAMYAAGGGSHAMVVYAQTPGSLWVADPNYPKDLREIKYNQSTHDLLPYSSGPNAQAIATGREKSYGWFLFAAKSALVPWDEVGSLYQSMTSGAAGNAIFPTYDVQVRVQLEDGTPFVEPLSSGYLTSLPKLDVGIRAPFDAMVYFFDGTSDTPFAQFEVNNTTSFASVPLGIGANELGIGVMGGPNSPSPNLFVDFRRLTLHRAEAVTTTTVALPATTVPPPTSPPTTEDCSIYPRGSIRWVECTIHSGAIGG